MVYVKFFGAAYLLYIGYQQYVAKGVSFETKSNKKSIIKLMIAGFVVGGTNPKSIIYYLSFLPVFIDLNNLTITTEMEVLSVVGITVLFVLSLANVLGFKLRAHLENRDVIKRVNEITGVTMMLVGVFVALY